MKTFLAVDFGSTYTKLHLLDLENCEILAASQAYTSIETSIYHGFQEAFALLQKQYAIDLEAIDRIRVCSSAAGGLKVSVIGLVPELTMEAAKLAALGAGAKLIGGYSFFLGEEEMQNLEESQSDIVLLAGGSNGGNSEILLHNARKLAASTLSCPILYCGNESIQEEIARILKDKTLSFAKNIMPAVNQLDIEDCREKIREIFFRNIIEAKGLEEVSKNLDKEVIPTPAAVLDCLSLYPAESSAMLLDIGGATTDVHSFAECKVFEKHCLLEGFKEAPLKRTVEGDLGMRYSALSVWEQIEESSALFTREEWKKACEKRQQQAAFLPDSEKEKAMDKALAQGCVNLAVRRHCGSLRKGYTVSEEILYQKGKDFRPLEYLIGSGGVLIHSEDPKAILKEALQKPGEEMKLLPKEPVFLLDASYLSSTLGLLSRENKEAAKKFLEKYFVTI